MRAVQAPTTEHATASTEMEGSSDEDTASPTRTPVPAATSNHIGNNQAAEAQLVAQARQVSLFSKTAWKRSQGAHGRARAGCCCPASGSRRTARAARPEKSPPCLLKHETATMNEYVQEDRIGFAKTLQQQTCVRLAGVPMGCRYLEDCSTPSGTSNSCHESTGET